MFPSQLLRCKISLDGNLSSETGPASEQNANYLLKAQLTMIMVMLMLVCFPACLFPMIVTEAWVLKLCTSAQSITQKMHFKKSERNVGQVILIRSPFSTTDSLTGIKSPLLKVSRKTTQEFQYIINWGCSDLSIPILK